MLRGGGAGEDEVREAQRRHGQPVGQRLACLLPKFVVGQRQVASAISKNMENIEYRV